MGIDLKKTIAHVKEAWVGKPKGMTQHMAATAGHGLGLNMTVDRISNVHPELEMEGVEYICANNKIYMRGVPILKRRNQKQFYDQERLPLLQQQGAMLTTTNIFFLSHNTWLHCSLPSLAFIQDQHIIPFKQSHLSQ
eukprot:11049351-Ditylum_brightwellii.AAC.1